MWLLAGKNKQGLSIVIGYILLIAISIVMSVIVFMWLRTYVPKDPVQCPDGTSVFIKDVFYNCTSDILDVTVKNNGKFSINGYFIHVSNRSGEELAVIDLSSRILSGGNTSGNAITFSLDRNSLSPTEPSNVKTCTFNATPYGQLYKIEIIPTRFQEEDNKLKFVSCDGAKVEQGLTCNT